LPEKLEIGNVTAKKGEFKKGVIKGIELNINTSIDVPVLVMNGVDEGATLLILSTQHGIEIQGIEVIHKVMREKISPKNLRGAVIGIPVANPLAYMHHMRTSWIDNLDPGGGGSRSFVRADQPHGNTTERLAYALWNEAWSKADLVINFHCNTRPDSLIWQEVNIGNPKTREKIEKMAEAFGVTKMVVDRPTPEDDPPTIEKLAVNKGVPVLVVELIDGRWISEPSTSVGVKGILNVMKAFYMIDGDFEPQEGITIVPGVNRWGSVIRANRGGLIRFFKKPGELIKQGEVLAEIYDLYGDVIESIKMPVDGYVWAYPGGDILGTSGSLQAVQTGANAAYVFTHQED